MDASASKRTLIQIKIYYDGRVQYEKEGKKQIFEVKDPSENLFNLFDIILSNFFANLSKETDKKLNNGYLVRYLHYQ